MSFDRLDAHCRSLESLDHALAILGVDEATAMAPGGGDARAQSMAGLAGMRHARATAPEVIGWIEAAKNEALEPWQIAAVNEIERDYVNLTCLPQAFVERQTTVRMRSEQAWRRLRAADDWKTYLPVLEEVVTLVREEAAMRADRLGLTPYDAMMEQYDPGNRAADIDPVFADLKTFLAGFLPEAIEADAARRKDRVQPGKGPYPVEAQRALALDLITALGFDLEHGSLSVSHHPFCGGVPSDVRLTTRYRTDEFLTALMGTLHESGHGVYEQNLPKAHQHLPSARARGMALHESQSLFVEKQIGRNPAFWAFAMPQLNERLGTDFDADTLLPLVHAVKPGLIRVDADEVTYPLHVILRYELEQELVAGTLAVGDLPEAWAAKLEAALGLAYGSVMKDGPMQDVHWPSGAFGYFPSYTLGAMMAAQQWAAILRAHPKAEAAMAQGEFSALIEWRKRNVWEMASTASTPAIMEAATGSPLDARYFIDHLKSRYGLKE